jgi:uncharacterized membrane protein YhhN
VGAVAAVVTVLGTAATLLLEPSQPTRARIAKMAASTGMIVLALSGDALSVGWARWAVVGLALSWIGDLALSYRGQQAFLAGLVAFFMAHVAYVIAFLVRGMDSLAVVVAGVLLAAIGVGVWRFLRPHIPDRLNRPVRAYVGVITLMVVTAAGSHVDVAELRLPVGAVAFYLSDLAVALDRFVPSERRHRYWGLPLYYGGQLLLAWAAATV